jgi:hypothetical protein
MKRLFSLLALMVACSLSFATVRTVCNMSYCAGTFANFNDAQSASSNGDTIYVQGSTIDYGSIEITKSLVIIGTGHNPNKQNPLVSTFVNILISTSNVQLIGLRLQHTGTVSGASGCVIKKCRITGSSGQAIVLSNATNWLIEGNIIETIGPAFGIFFSFQPSHNTIIQNNVFLGTYFKIAALLNTVAERTYILNNVFLGPLTGYETFSEVDFCSVDNNIFYHSNPDGNNPFSIRNSTMNNNISFGSGDNSFNLIGTNNLAGVDPQFVNYSGPPAQFDYAIDLSLQSTSPGHNTGTDTTDRGVYGGVGNKFTETGEPSIAEITAFSITSPSTIPPGGSLTISVTSKIVH